jgi:hypothetical protein
VATARLQIAREETKRRLEEQGIQVGIGKSGNAFDLAREDNPGKWVKQLLLQRDAERQRFLEQLTKEYAKEFPSGGASDVELRKSWLYAKFDCFHEKQNSVKRQRALDSAEAHDRIDRLVAKTKEAAQKLWKTDEEDDIDLLANTLTPVIEALKKYEEIAEPTFFDDHPLNELANALFIATHLRDVMGPIIRDREEMTRLRAKKTLKIQTKNQAIEALATQFREQDPERSVRSMALKIGEKVKLKTNTVEKKLAAVGF